MTDHDCTVFFLPGLGFGSAASAPIAAALGDRFRVVGIDPPGQAQTPEAADGSVFALVDSALAAIEARADGGPFVIAAHSLGGKIAALVTSRLLRGEANVFGLVGLVLLAPSPPTPEPMDDDKRQEMLSWAEDGALSEAHAREFVAQNVAEPLAVADENDAVAQVRQTSPLAWRRWLAEGSRQDVSGTVGVIEVPVVVLAGEDDDDLGSSAQPQLLRTVYPRARFVSLAATGHLLPYERPGEVAAEIVRFWEALSSSSPRIAPDWGLLIASDRTAVEARALLTIRALADDPEYTPEALSAGQLETLRALAHRLVPQSATGRIDLAARVDADLAAGRGDGWRPAELPDDASAYRLGLDALASVWPDGVAEQDALIERIIAGEPIPDAPWTDDALTLWFEDLRTDLARTWLAHPASLARVGYDGFATSGQGADAVGDVSGGYLSIGAGLRDPWEPADLGVLASGTSDSDESTEA